MKEKQQDAVDRIAEQWQAQRPDVETLPMTVLGRMWRISKHAEKHISDLHKQFGLTQGEFDVLATLRRSGEPYSLTPSELFNTMMLSSGAMTNRLDRLEEKGMILREHSTEDRRSVTVSLTETGRNLIDKALTAHVDTQANLLGTLSPEQQEQLALLLKDWLKNFE